MLLATILSILYICAFVFVALSTVADMAFVDHFRKSGSAKVKRDTGEEIDFTKPFNLQMGITILCKCFFLVFLGMKLFNLWGL